MSHDFIVNILNDDLSLKGKENVFSVIYYFMAQNNESYFIGRRGEALFKTSIGGKILSNKFQTKPQVC